MSLVALLVPVPAMALLLGAVIAAGPAAPAAGWRRAGVLAPPGGDGVGARFTVRERFARPAAVRSIVVGDLPHDLIQEEHATRVVDARQAGRDRVEDLARLVLSRDLGVLDEDERGQPLLGAEAAEKLLPRYVEVQLFWMVLEAQTSEFAARMTAMDSATSNAKEMIDRLTLTFNRARQAAITKELMDIVNGAEALQ